MDWLCADYSTAGGPSTQRHSLHKHAVLVIASHFDTIIGGYDMEYDPSYRYTPEQQQEASAWLASKGVKPICPVCGSSDTEPFGSFPTRPESKNSSVHLKTITVMCGSCGYLMDFAMVE